MRYLDLVLLASVVMTAVVMLSNRGRSVALSSGGAGPEAFMRITKLPMPIQKAMARPATNPTTAP